MDYNCVLKKTKKTAMNRNDIQDVLGVSRATFLKFWNKVFGKVIILNDNGEYQFINTFSRGKLKNVDDPVVKAFINKIRELYTNTPLRQQRYLGYIFNMLNYLNLETNVLCENVFETDRSKVIPITMKRFCNILGLDVSNASRIRNMYRKITINCGGKQRYFCKFLQSSNDPNDYYPVVNPYVICHGDIEKRNDIMAWYFEYEDSQLQEELIKGEEAGRPKKRNIMKVAKIP